MATSDQLLTASSAANRVILDLGLKQRMREGYTRVDPNFVASRVGVPVMYRVLERLLGGFIRDGSAVGILVNSDRPRGLVHMTCAHELGHYFLGHESTADEVVEQGPTASLLEQLADQFAYSLLAPRWLIAQIMSDHGWTLVDLQNAHVVYQLSLRLGTSYTAMVWSLHRLKLCSPATRNRLIAVKPKMLKAFALRGGVLEDANADVWVLGSADKDRILEPGYGDRFVVELPNHAGSGHLWTANEVRSEGFVLEPLTVDARIHRPEAREMVSVGGGDSTISYYLQPPEKFRSPPRNEDDLDPIDDRRRAVELRELRPWALDASAISVLNFSTEFEPGREGLSVSERHKRVERMQQS